MGFSFKASDPKVECPIGSEPPLRWAAFGVGNKACLSPM
jgi:hypothetical protein